MNKHEFRGLSGLLALYATRMLGLFMVLPVLTLYLDQYTGSTTLLMGVALGVYGLTQGLDSGCFPTRWGARRLLSPGWWFSWWEASWPPMPNPFTY